MAMDMNGKGAFNEWTEEERKELNFWLLNRYASSVAGTREAKELAVVLTNENYNKNWNVLGTRHPSYSGSCYAHYTMQKALANNTFGKD